MDLLGEGLRQAVALLTGGDREVWSILWLSLAVSGTATSIALLIGIPLGTLLEIGRAHV